VNPEKTRGVNYDYDAAAERYDAHRQGGGPFLPFLCELAQETHAKTVLELGPGTGNNTRAFMEAYPCVLIGLEPSRGMLLKGIRKVPAAKWIRGSALAIPLRSNSCDFIFAVLVLHHIRDLAPVMHECHRVLRSGYAAFVTSPHDFIDRHPMNRYFPSFAEIDKRRFHPIKTIQQSLRDAGFTHVGQDRIVGPPQTIDEAYVRKVEGRFLSTFDLIPPEEYQAGLDQLRADVAKHGALPIELRWECVIVWGRR